MRQLILLFFLIGILAGPTVIGQTQAIEATTTTADPLFDRIKMYPIPMKGYLNIQVKDYEYEQLDLRIKDITGKMVQQEKLLSVVSQGRPFQIDVIKLPEGVYLIDIVNPDDQQMISRRILKQ